MLLPLPTPLRLSERLSPRRRAPRPRTLSPGSAPQVPQPGDTVRGVAKRVQNLFFLSGYFFIFLFIFSLAGAAGDAGQEAVVGTLLAGRLPFAAGRRGLQRRRRRRRWLRALPPAPVPCRGSPAALPRGSLRSPCRPARPLLPAHRHAAAGPAGQAATPRSQRGSSGGLSGRGLLLQRHPPRLPGLGVPPAPPPAAETPRHRRLRRLRPRRGLPRARPAPSRRAGSAVRRG